MNFMIKYDKTINNSSQYVHVYFLLIILDILFKFNELFHDITSLQVELSRSSVVAES